MSLFFAAGSPTTEITPAELRTHLYQALDLLGPRKKVLAIPPDFTRMHSQSGLVTELAWLYYSDRLTDILPALGTHKPMTDKEIAAMYGETPRHLFRVHDWRNDIVTLGEVPGGFIREVSEGRLDYTWPAQVNKLLVENRETGGGHDLILSIGQVVPHEVVGMANYNKNIFVGTGGSLGIHRSHFLGAVYGMERMMGRADTPVRRVLNYASDRFAQNLPIVYVQTVVGKNDAGKLVLRGLYIGDDVECFERAAALSLQVNFKMLDREIKKAVVFLDPREFRSTWAGQTRAVYRTRMALADDAELIVLAPGVREFGEDAAIDALIRKYGYCGTPRALEAVKEDPQLAGNLSAAAPPHPRLQRGARFHHPLLPRPPHPAGDRVGPLCLRRPRRDDRALQPRSPSRTAGNTVNGEEIFYISNPGLGLWAYEKTLQNLKKKHAKKESFSSCHPRRGLLLTFQKHLSNGADFIIPHRRHSPNTFRGSSNAHQHHLLDASQIFDRRRRQVRPPGQGPARRLSACLRGRSRGHPGPGNKSNREHLIIGFRSRRDPQSR